MLELTAETWVDTEAFILKTFAPSLKQPEDQANVIRIKRVHRMGVSNSHKDSCTILQSARYQKPRGILRQ